MSNSVSIAWNSAYRASNRFSIASSSVDQCLKDLVQVANGAGQVLSDSMHFLLFVIFVFVVPFYFFLTRLMF